MLHLICGQGKLQISKCKDYQKPTRVWQKVVLGTIGIVYRTLIEFCEPIERKLMYFSDVLRGYRNVTLD